MTRKWNYQALTHEQKHAEEALERKYAGVEPVCELLAERGIRTVDEAERFFHPSLRNLHDPFLMPGMDRAVERLNRALGAKERIMVYGDYDVDGTTAVALVYKYLLAYYSNITFYIPTRYDDGYGVSRAGIDTAAEQGVKLIIVLDYGIKAIDEVAYAKSLGIDFIICDHHMSDEQLPDAAAILNPKLEGSTYPCPHLSACGVGYKFMQGFAISNDIPTTDLESMLDLVAVSIAADLVPMVGENRILAYQGLRRLNSSPNVGLRAIISICGLTGKELTISDVIFKIGPRINASGRMQCGSEAVELLVSRDFSEALRKANEIDQYNKDRKELDKRITDEANAILDEHSDRVSNSRSIVIYNKDWHKGIIGIVASRITELYYKPTVVLTLSGGMATGSSRSVQGFDVYKAINAQRDLLENFGGHSYAVGLSLREENIPEFRRRFEEYVSRNIEEWQLTPSQNIDAFITFSQLSNRLIGILRRFAPYGPGNSKPVFCTRQVSDFGTSRLVGRNLEHIKLDMVDETSGKVFSGIAFNMADKFETVHSGRPFTICYTIEELRHSRPDASAIQLQVKAINPDI